MLRRVKPSLAALILTALAALGLVSNPIVFSGQKTTGFTSGALLKDNGSGALGSYAGTSCTNQFPRSLSAAGAATCASVAEADQTLADNTTANVSTSAHGYVPKLTNTADSYMDQTGTNRLLPRILCNSGTATSTTNDTNEHNLAVCTIPAGIMGTNGRIEIWVLVVFTGTASTKAPLIRHSTSSGDISAGTLLQNVSVSANALSLVLQKTFWNANSASVQKAMNNATSAIGVISTSTVTSGAINTANASYININCLVGNAGDTCGYLGYTVTFYPGV